MRGFARPGAERGRTQTVGIGCERADALGLTVERAGRTIDLRDSALIAVMSDALLWISGTAGLIVDDIESGKTAPDWLPLDDRELTRKPKARCCTWEPPPSSGSGAGYTLRPSPPVPCSGGCDGGQTVTDERLTPKSVSEIVKRDARFLNIEGAGGHSLWIGSAQSLEERGTSLVEMEHVGRRTRPWMPAR